MKGGFKASCRTVFRLCWEALSPGLPQTPATQISGSCPQALAPSWLRVEARGGRKGLNMDFQTADHSGLLFPLGCPESVPAQSVSVSIATLPAPTPSPPFPSPPPPPPSFPPPPFQVLRGPPWRVRVKGSGSMIFQRFAALPCSSPLGGFLGSPGPSWLRQLC